MAPATRAAHSLKAGTSTRVCCVVCVQFDACPAGRTTQTIVNETLLLLSLETSQILLDNGTGMAASDACSGSVDSTGTYSTGLSGSSSGLSGADVPRAPAWNNWTETWWWAEVGQWANGCAWCMRASMSG